MEDKSGDTCVYLRTMHGRKCFLPSCSWSTRITCANLCVIRCISVSMITRTTIGAGC